MSDEALKTTVLTGAHRAAGGRMVAFAGYDMPVQYPAGILKEHLWTREHAGLFDVSHMGPAFLDLLSRTGDGEADHAAVAALIEPLVSGDIAGLKPGQLRYTLLLNENGGILDDLMIGRPHQPLQPGPALYRGQRRLQGGGFRADRGRRSATRPCSPAPMIARSSPCRGRRRRTFWPACCRPARTSPS